MTGIAVIGLALSVLASGAEAPHLDKNDPEALLAAALKNVNFNQYKVVNRTEPRTKRSDRPEILAPSQDKAARAPAMAAPSPEDCESIDAWNGFTCHQKFTWTASFDQHTGAPLLAEGKGIPLRFDAPVEEADAVCSNSEKRSLETIEAATNRFFQQHSALLKADPKKFVFDQLSSAVFGRYKNRGIIRYAYIHQEPDGGISTPVLNAYVYFRVDMDCIVQFGNQTGLPIDGITKGVKLDEWDEVLDNTTAEQFIADKFDNMAVIQKSGADTVLKHQAGRDAANLQIVPYNTDAGTRRYKLVRTHRVVVGDEIDVELWLDAAKTAKNRIVFAINHLHYADAHVKGDVYRDEIPRSLPFLKVADHSTFTHTDANGLFESAHLTPPTHSSLTNGKYVRVHDTCADSSAISTERSNNIHFHTSDNYDSSPETVLTCDSGNPPIEGSTFAARSAYYHLNYIKAKSRFYFDGTSVGNWITQPLNVHVNYQKGACRGRWVEGNLGKGMQEDQINLFKMSTRCINPGESPGLIYHEFAHGLDHYTNRNSKDEGSKEAFADVTAFMQTRQSCIADGLKKAICSAGCKQTGCTGLRELALLPPVTPDNIDQEPTNCDVPHNAAMQQTNSTQNSVKSVLLVGPMGLTSHCEGLIASSAAWYLAQQLVKKHGTSRGWALANRLWHESMYDTESAYQVSGGNTDSDKVEVDGCGAKNWYTVLATVDDDNADLSDGTPNGDIIWEAFNRHGISCGEKPKPSSSCESAQVPSAPQLSINNNGSTMELTWTKSAEAVSYILYQGTEDTRCENAMLPLEELMARNKFEISIPQGINYSYQVQAVGVNESCVSNFSNCINVHR